MSVTARLKRPPEAAAPPVLRLLAWKRVLLVAGICVLPVLLYAPFFNEPFMRDEGYYAAASQAMLHSAVPYTDFFDNKPPLIYSLHVAIPCLLAIALWKYRIWRWAAFGMRFPCGSPSCTWANTTSWMAWPAWVRPCLPGGRPPGWRRRGRSGSQSHRA